MTADMLDLARRAVACKGFRWLPGMLDVHGGRVVSVEGGLLRLDYRDDDDPIRTSTSACLPDLTDPATLGCFLALIRAAWDNPCIAIRGWRDEDMDDLYYEVVGLDEELTADAEAEAYVLALEKAPCP